MTVRGQVKKGVVVFRGDAALPDGTVVEVTPVNDEAVPPSVAPHAGAARYPVSDEQREALLQLIGLWKTDQPPNDEEVERILEDERMRKYG